jgi:hypothetical protein
MTNKLDIPADIRQIIFDAILAPSGENCQPWKFILRPDESNGPKVLDLMLLPDRDQSLYSWGQRASYMANGAVLENLTISARECGYEPKVALFPDKNNQNLVARITLEKGSPAGNVAAKNATAKDPLYPFIAERSTNRKKYDTVILDAVQKQVLLDCSDSGPTPNASSVPASKISVLFTEDSEKMKSLAAAGSVNESVMMSNRYLHQFFFSHINWTKEEDDETKIGFFIDTLELPPPALAGFKLFKNWPLTNLLNKVGLSKMVGKQNSQIYAASSGIGIITVPDLSAETFVRAGRVLERLWLTTTSLGLSFQPLSGLLFFMYRIMANDTERFSPAQVEAIKDAYANIRGIFGLTGEAGGNVSTASDKPIVAFMFRIGHGGKPTARSARFSVDEVVEIKD